MRNNKNSWASKIPGWAWVILSFVAALVVWYILSILPSTSRAFPFAPATINGLITMVERGVFWDDLSSSLISVALGYGLGVVIALPVAILMAWAGIGRPAQVTTITIACFLIMCVTIYQGVINVDETLIKAARVLGAKNRDIFVRVLAPATLPFILTAIRLGASVALTTIIAAESAGSVAGLGMRIRALSSNFENAPMLAYVIVLGIIGILLEKGIRFLEKKLTGWQETIN